MWQAFKKADPAIKAAIISGIFALIVAIITGTFSLIKLGTGQPSPTPSSVRTTHPITTPSPQQAFVQHPRLQSEYSSKDSVPFSLPVKAGDLIIVAITQWVGEVSSVKDDRGDTFTSVVKKAPYAVLSTSSDSVDGQNHDYAQLYYSQYVAGGTTTVIVTFKAKENNNVGIYEFKGFDRTAALDVPVSNTSNSQNADLTHPNGGTLNTTTNNELCFVVGVDDDGNNKTPDHGNQYGHIDDSQPDQKHERYYTEYLIAAPKGSYQTDFTIDTDSHWAVVGAAFKP